jgi:hypothetical protein
VIGRIDDGLQQTRLHHVEALTSTVAAVAEGAEVSIGRRSYGFEDTDALVPALGRSTRAGHRRVRRGGLDLCVERVRRIELPYSAWEADVLPLNYTRNGVQL